MTPPIAAWRATSLFAVAAASAACAPTSAPAPAPPPIVQVDTVVRVDTVQVEVEAAADAALEARVARLQIQVLERDVQIGELQGQLESTQLELVRNLARMQTEASRAEAASGMAEAEVALGTLRRSSGGEALPDFRRAEALLEQSSREFAGENYGGALYLATQVRTLVRGAQSRLAASADGELRSGEELFAVPLPLSTRGRSNVRSGPGLDFDVLFTLDPASPLVGQSYTSQWVRIVDDTGREGWIFHTLVTSR
jgi:hypothetical protein